MTWKGLLGAGISGVCQSKIVTYSLIKQGEKGAAGNSSVNCMENPFQIIAFVWVLQILIFQASDVKTILKVILASSWINETESVRFTESSGIGWDQKSSPFLSSQPLVGQLVLTMGEEGKSAFK